MSEIHGRRPRRCKFEFSFIRNHLRPSQKSGTHPENRNAPDSPDLSPSIPDDRDIYDFEFSLIRRQNLGQSGTGKSPIVWDFPDIWKPGFKQQRRRRLLKRHLKSEVALPRTFSCLFHLIQFLTCWQFFLESNSKRLYRSSRSAQNVKIVVVQWREGNVPKNMMHPQDCFFFFLNKPIAFLPFSFPSAPQKVVCTRGTGNCWLRFSGFCSNLVNLLT